MGLNFAVCPVWVEIETVCVSKEHERRKETLRFQMLRIKTKVSENKLNFKIVLGNCNKFAKFLLPCVQKIVIPEVEFPSYFPSRFFTRTNHRAVHSDPVVFSDK